MNRRHKMHKGEIIFHIIVPLILLGVTLGIAFCVITLVTVILLHQ